MSRRKIKSDLSSMATSCKYLSTRNSSFVMNYTSLRTETLVSFVSKIVAYKNQLQLFKKRLQVLQLECEIELHIFFREFNRKCGKMLNDVNSLIRTCNMLELRAVKLIAEFRQDYVFKLGGHILKSLASLIRFNIKLSFFKRDVGKFIRFNASITSFSLLCTEYNHKLRVVLRR